MNFTETLDDDTASEYEQVVGKAKKKESLQTILNKRYVTEEEMDAVFLGE